MLGITIDKKRLFGLDFLPGVRHRLRGARARRRKTVASRCDCIYIGVLAAWLRVYAPELWDRHAVKCLIAGIILLLVSFCIPPHIGTVYTDIFSLSVPPIAYALWLPFLSRIRSSSTKAGTAVSPECALLCNVPDQPSGHPAGRQAFRRRLPRHGSLGLRPLLATGSHRLPPTLPRCGETICEAAGQVAQIGRTT